MFDLVSYLMGKKSGGGGGSSIANALFVTFTPAGPATLTADFTAGQLAEAVDNEMKVVLYIEDEGSFFSVSRSGFQFSVSVDPSGESVVGTMTASSADSNTFTMTV